MCPMNHPMAKTNGMILAITQKKIHINLSCPKNYFFPLPNIIISAGLIFQAKNLGLTFNKSFNTHANIPCTKNNHVFCSSPPYSFLSFFFFYSFHLVILFPFTDLLLFLLPDSQKSGSSRADVLFTLIDYPVSIMLARDYFSTMGCLHFNILISKHWNKTTYFLIMEFQASENKWGNTLLTKT